MTKKRTPRKHSIVFTQPTLTQQNFADETNINKIMAQFRKTGLIEHVNKHQGHYGDYSEPIDFQAALNLVNEAERMFLSLPADIRKHFNNNPDEFLTFTSDPANREKMGEMGLLDPNPNYVPPKDEKPAKEHSDAPDA